VTSRIQLATEENTQRHKDVVDGCHLKKGDMAREAERLLDGTDWLPEPLRLVEVDATGQDADGATRPKPRCQLDTAAASERTPRHSAASTAGG
jgi:hypothetical protein